jgi:ankyrin repeat protein
MNKRPRRRGVLLLGLVSLVLAGSFCLWVNSNQRQEALNRQLIVALVKQDTKQALALVNAGADPNTPVEPPLPPSLTQLWNRVFHRKALPRNYTPSAFHIACGAYVYNGDDTLASLSADEPHLVETMLQHGAHKNANGGGWTPLLWSVYAEHPETVDVLLNHGVNVNAQDADGDTALFWVVMTAYAANPSKGSRDADLVRHLLAHGADPNLPGLVGQTPLQMAHDSNRSDLVALLKQAGAKK